MTLHELLSALNALDDYTKIGHLIKDATSFVPETDAEYHAKRLWEHFFRTNTAHT